MNKTATSIAIAILFMTIAPATFSCSAAVAPAAAPTIFDNVAAILRERFYDKKFREEQLPALIEKYRPSVGSPPDVNAQRTAAENLLAHVPASHLGLLSDASYRYLIAELSGQPQPGLGFQLVRIEAAYFTSFVLEDGPAARAGIQPWERVVSIDGAPVEKSVRLDWAQKDAYLPVDRDPPIHSILCRAGDEVAVVLERRPDEQRMVKLIAQPYSALEAARKSARLLEIEGRSVGYVHFWFIHSTGVPEMLRELFAGEFAEADGLILDLRGRGGNGVVVPDILQILADWKRPIVALTDRQSRSAKDALAYEFKERHLATLVGEKTAGAVIPATFAPVGESTVLMFPSFTLGEYTRKLELKGGVTPDVFVERAGPYSGGNDPILERGKQEIARLVKEVATVAPASRPSPSAVQPSVPPVGPGNLPALSDLIVKMTNALGGEKVIRAHSHRTLTGTTELIGLPMKGDYVQKASAPDRSAVVMHLGDLIVRQGFDGKVAWSDTPMTGKQIMTGAAADLIRQQAQFYGPLDLVRAYREITFSGLAVFEGRQCVELKLAGHSGTISFLYIDAETYLAVGTKMNVETPIGMVETKTYLRKYRDFGGFITASEIAIESSVQRQVIRIDTVTFDEIPATEYAPPPGAK
ncbi:MAG: carboxyl-terminal processing protease [Verrucomicrobiota bacterium]|jgi:carboxyl-terminal processing protease